MSYLLQTILILLAHVLGVPRGSGKVALDVGVVCPQAASHPGEAATESLGAAESYVKQKCGRADTEERCRVANVRFQPMIFESLGGVSAEAEAVIKCLNKMVAENTDTPETEVATQFWRRLSIDIQRSGHRAFSRRVRSGLMHEGDSFLLRSFGLAAGLEVAEGM